MLQLIRNRGRGLLLIMVLIAIVAAGLVYAKRRAIHHYAWLLKMHYATPNIAWETASPSQEGMDGAALKRLRDDLAKHGTEAFLVVRHNHIVYEWYASDFGPNRKHGLAASAKAVVGSMAMLAGMSEGRLALDDPAWKYIPQWRDDPVRSKIRIRDLAFHTSGIQDVDFVRADEGKVAGWKSDYYDHPAQRFTIAIQRTPIIFPPGSHVSYAGVGYYLLAYAETDALQGGPEQDLKTLLRNRIMRPLGIPDDDWQLSYGHSYHVDGMHLYAFGSGASYTARAMARIGQLVLQQGHFNGRTLFNPKLLQQLLTPADLPYFGPAPANQPASGGGWWLNRNCAWPELPKDAAVGAGNGDETILVVPSLDLVAVRLGKALSDDKGFFTVLGQRLYGPLMHAVLKRGPGSAAERCKQPADS